MRDGTNISSKVTEFGETYFFVSAVNWILCVTKIALQFSFKQVPVFVLLDIRFIRVPSVPRCGNVVINIYFHMYVSSRTCVYMKVGVYSCLCECAKEIFVPSLPSVRSFEAHSHCSLPLNT